MQENPTIPERIPEQLELPIAESRTRDRSALGDCFPDGDAHEVPAGFETGQESHDGQFSHGCFRVPATDAWVLLGVDRAATPRTSLPVADFRFLIGREADDIAWRTYMARNCRMYDQVEGLQLRPSRGPFESGGRHCCW